MLTLETGSIADCELIEQVRLGDRYAFETLVRRYAGLVYMIAFGRLADRDAAEDLTQEVWLRVYLHLDQFDPERRFSTWVSRITHNLAIDWLRKQQTRSHFLCLIPLEEMNVEPADRDASGGWEQIQDQEREAMLQDALGRLPAEMREIIVLRYGAELNNREIADHLGIHPSTIGRQLQKAIALMRTEVRQMLEDSARILAGPGRHAATRSLGVIGVLATFTGETKAALAATAGLTATSPAPSAAASAAPVGALFGQVFAWIVWPFQALLSAVLNLAAVAPKATPAVKMALASAALIGAAGGGYYATNVVRGELSSTAATANFATEQQEVRAAFAELQRRCRAGDTAGMVAMYDLPTWAKMLGIAEADLRARLTARAGTLAPLIAGATLGEVSVEFDEPWEIEVDSQRDTNGQPLVVRIEPPVIRVQAGDWDGRFHRTPAGWRLIFQNVTGETARRTPVNDAMQLTFE